jgi:hypothetical protein
MQHGHAAGTVGATYTCSMDMPNYQTAWTCSMDLYHRQAAGTCIMEMQRKCSMDKQYGHTSPDFAKFWPTIVKCEIYHLQKNLSDQIRSRNVDILCNFKRESLTSFCLSVRLASYTILLFREAHEIRQNPKDFVCERDSRFAYQYLKKPGETRLAVDSNVLIQRVL